MNGNSEAAKIRAVTEQAQLAALLELAKNPVIELAAGVMFLNWATMPRPGDNFFQGFFRGVEASTLFPSLVAIIAAQQIAPALPYIPDRITSLLPALPGG